MPHGILAITLDVNNKIIRVLLRSQSVLSVSDQHCPRYLLGLSVSVGVVVPSTQFIQSSVLGQQLYSEDCDGDQGF